MRSRSHRVVEEVVVVVGDSLRQSCWANMPQELLREVLIRIEASEDTWPPRKSVVACAGVCRSWREITKEIVKTPQLSAKITFPISVKQVISLSLFPISLSFLIWAFHKIKFLLFLSSISAECLKASVFILFTLSIFMLDWVVFSGDQVSFFSSNFISIEVNLNSQYWHDCLNECNKVMLCYFVSLY